MAHRRFTFLRLHLITWLVLLVGVTTIALAQLPPAGQGWRPPNTYGWPTTGLSKWPLHGGWTYVPTISPPEWHWHLSGIVINLAVAATLLFPAVFVVEQWLRSEARFQFRIATLLKWTVATAITLSVMNQWGHFLRLKPWASDLEQFAWLIQGLYKLPMHLQLPIIAGMLCTAFVLVSLCVVLAQRILQLKKPTDRATTQKEETPARRIKDWRISEP